MVLSIMEDCCLSVEVAHANEIPNLCFCFKIYEVRSIPQLTQERTILSYSNYFISNVFNTTANKLEKNFFRILETLCDFSIASNKLVCHEVRISILRLVDVCNKSFIGS
mmetsp:Transcript_23417/g.26259  ORF Transcript_23417/g.26259 Transcript_23417/m.26259 type:complete len:109 (-) Transcript_23417:2800-3126(-)